MDGRGGKGWKERSFLRGDAERRGKEEEEEVEEEVEGEEEEEEEEEETG